MKRENPIKSLALQKWKDNAVSSMKEYKYINYYMCTTAAVRDCMCKVIY